MATITKKLRLISSEKVSVLQDPYWTAGSYFLQKDYKYVVSVWSDGSQTKEFNSSDDIYLKEETEKAVLILAVAGYNQWAYKVLDVYKEKVPCTNTFNSQTDFRLSEDNMMLTIHRNYDNKTIQVREYSRVSLVDGNVILGTPWIDKMVVKGEYLKETEILAVKSVEEKFLYAWEQNCGKEESDDQRMSYNVYCTAKRYRISVSLVDDSLIEWEESR